MILDGEMPSLEKYADLLNLEPQEPFSIFRFFIIKFFTPFSWLDTARPGLKPAKLLELPIIGILHPVTMLISLPAEMRSQGSLGIQEDR
jgi:hypothetical protein